MSAPHQRPLTDHRRDGRRARLTAARYQPGPIPISAEDFSMARWSILRARRGGPLTTERRAEWTPIARRR